jgi:hypothetical protein
VTILNVLILHDKGLLTFRPIPKLEDHSLSAPANTCSTDSQLPTILYCLSIRNNNNNNIIILRRWNEMSELLAQCPSNTNTSEVAVLDPVAGSPWSPEEKVDSESYHAFSNSLLNLQDVKTC